MTNLTQTHLPPDLPKVPKSSAVSAAAFFARKDLLMRWCLVVAAGALACSLLSLGVAVKSSREPVLIAVLDGAGVIHVADGLPFDEARELHVHQALLAATALLLRNPVGFDLAELLENLFVGQGLTQANAIKAAEAPEFESKQIHQKPQVSRIEALEIRPDAVLIQAEGQLLRSGIFQKQAFTEVLPFVLKLTLQHNPNLLRKRRHPTVVTDFQLDYEAAR